MNQKRSYTMRARAERVEETRRRILQASFDLRQEWLEADIGLDGIADRAGVSVQTVLRHFGSKDQLFDATEDFARDAVVEERRAPVGDIEAAVEAIVNHYEIRGDGVVIMLAQEAGNERIRQLTTKGKAMHREWVREVFAPQLAATRLPVEHAVDLLVVATDVYTWKLLRRDRALSRPETERRIHQLVTAILDATPD